MINGRGKRRGEEETNIKEEGEEEAEIKRLNFGTRKKKKEKDEKMLAPLHFFNNNF